MSTRQSLGRHGAGPARPARSRHAAPRTGRKRTALVVGGTLAFTGAGTATAAWVAMGSGTVEGQAITASQLQIDNEVTTPDLYPGAAGTVTVEVTNPNPFPVAIHEAAFRNLTITPLAGKTCATSNVTLAPTRDLRSSGIVLAAADPGSTADTATITLASALTMIADAADGCQGASFSLIVDLTGESAA